MGNPSTIPAARSRRIRGTRRRWGRAACVGLVVLGCAFARAGWAQRSYDDLDDAVRDLTRTLVERGELVALFSAADLAGKRVLVKSDDFFETETGFRLPLSKVLSRKCATELTRSRVPVALEGSDEDAVRVLHGRWKRVPGGRLDLTLFVAEPVQGRGEPVALVSVEGRVPIEGIKPEDIAPTLEHWGRYLVRRLDRGVRDQGRRTVRIQPLSVRARGVARADELGRELADWLGEALLESRWFDFVEPAPSGSVETVQVDGELLGTVSVRGDHVKVSLRVLDNQRRRVTAASVELPKVLLDEALFGTAELPPRVFILTRERLASNEDPREWAAGQKVAIGPMGTDIRRTNVVRYLEALGMTPVFIPRPEIAVAIAMGIVDGVVTVDDRLVGEVWPRYTGAPAELRSRSDFNESGDVAVVANP